MGEVTWNPDFPRPVPGPSRPICYTSPLQILLAPTFPVSLLPIPISLVPLSIEKTHVLPVLAPILSEVRTELLSVLRSPLS